MLYVMVLMMMRKSKKDAPIHLDGAELTGGGGKPNPERAAA
jgi:hypothetical protein